MRIFLRHIPGVIILFISAALLGRYLGTSGYSRAYPPNVLRKIRNVVAVPYPASFSPIYALSLSRIFSTDHSWVKSLASEKIVTMIATGDVIPARSVNSGMIARNNFRWPFEKTADVLSSADLTVINLETPLLSKCRPTIEGMIFCGDSRVVEGLTYAGIDVATLGNNHLGNYFEAGVEETKQHLSDAGILPVSLGVTYKEVKGTRFAFLSYNDIGSPEAGVPWAEETKIISDIAKARTNADVVIVSYHWGVEYVTEPTLRQQGLAHISIDAGADVVLGNHPHRVQPVEIYKDKFIIYAHGNFVFDQEWSEETKLGVVGLYTFYEGRLIDVEYFPVRIIDYGQPYFLESVERQAVLDSMQFISARMVK